LEETFGLVFPTSLEKFIKENELVRVARYFKLDVDQLRRAMGEFAREAMVGFRVNADSAWFHLCQLQASEGLHHTAVGDANFPEFGGMR